MKKTLVAVAALSAVFGAQAQATIYGNIDQAVANSKLVDSGDVLSKKTSITGSQMGGSLIGVKGEEDIGGVKASYLYEFGVAADTGATVGNRQAFVGLSGGFGALRVGKQYSKAFLNVLGADPFGATGPAGAISTNLVLTDGGTATDDPLRQSNGFQYDLPTFVPGLSVGVTKVYGEADTGADDNAGDGTGYNINYTTGPLSLGYTSDTVTNAGFGLLEAVDVIAASTTDKRKLTTLAGSYDLGVAKLSISKSDIKIGDDTVTGTLFGAAVPFGNTTFLWSTSTGSASTSVGVSNLDPGALSLKGTQYGLNHALSKRTVVYFHAGSMTATDSADNTAKITGSALGVHHSF